MHDDPGAHRRQDAVQGEFVAVGGLRVEGDDELLGVAAGARVGNAAT